jgi:hypothetical protein
VEFSVKSAQQGYEICKDSKFLFTSLQEHAPIAEIRETVSLMRKAVDKMRRRSEATADSFREVRQGLYVVRSLIQWVVQF